MKRREFLTATSAAGIATMTGAMPRAMAAEDQDARSIYELRQYQVETDAQRDALLEFMCTAMLPALKRLGLGPVGVFVPEEELSPVYLLIPHPDTTSLATLTERLLADSDFLAQGAGFLDAPAESPAYTRMTTSVLKAFEGMPALETPVTDEGRILQLRIYESPSVKTGQKKIEMFNIGEIQIFRDTGLHPVFFGEAIAGDRMPNLTYMLAFKDQAEREANWKTFVNSDAWKEISSKPEYADKKILCNITNLFLKSAPCSEI